jgi:hypothetical protein
VIANTQPSPSAKRAVPELYPYIESYSNKFLQIFGSGPEVRRTRVAILDSGILNIPPLQTEKDENKGLWPRIAEGESFIDNTTRLPPWQFSSDPHGTQIANVISAIDPHCEIYVAKITEGRHGILPDNVAEVCGVALYVHAAAFSVYTFAFSVYVCFLCLYDCCFRPHDRCLRYPDRLLTWSSIVRSPAGYTMGQGQKSGHYLDELCDPGVLLRQKGVRG